MSDIETIDVIPLPHGWVALQAHLVRFHEMDESAVEAMDTDMLRNVHVDCHTSWRFASGRRHGHF